MSSVAGTPATSRAKTRVWIRPEKFGTIGLQSDLPVGRPSPPVGDGATDTDAMPDALAGEVVGDVLSGELQAEEGVDSGEVAAERRRADGVDPPGLASRAPHPEGALDVEAPERVAGRAAVLEQVREHAVLADVRLEARAVDDEVRRQLERRAVAVRDHRHDLAVRSLLHVADLSDVGAVEALAAPPRELLDPELAVGRVRPAEDLVVPLAVLALERPELVAGLAAPRRLGPVEALVRPSVRALAPQEDRRAAGVVDVGAEEVDDRGLRAAVAVVDETLQDPRPNDAAPPDHHGARA